MTSPDRVAICMPIYGPMDPHAVVSFTELLYHTTSLGLSCGSIFQTNTYIDRGRNQCVKHALDLNASHIMWIDSDMVIPHDAIVRFLSHGLPIVGGLYFQRGEPYHPVNWHWNDTDRSSSSFSFTFNHNFKPDELQPVDGIGTGCLLVSTIVFKTMRDQFNDEKWFQTSLDHGDDVWFFHRLRSMNFPIYLDASVKCGHINPTVIDINTWSNYEVQ